MALPVRQQLTYWGIAAAAFLAVLWVLGDVVLPFIIGGAIAYLLDPLADRLERLGLGRIMATVAVSVLMLLIGAVFALMIFPLMVDQTLSLANAAPDFARAAQTALSDRFPALNDPDSTLRKTLLSIGDAVKSEGGALVKGALASALSIINTLAFIVIVPVVSFYLLMDWDHMIARIDGLLPMDHAPTIRKLASEVDEVLSGFVRGQALVCLLLGGFYAIGLMIVGLEFGLVVGVIAGILSFIPYVGTLVGGLLSIGLALSQFWSTPWLIAVVAAIFVIGQLVEGNVLSPKLVGGSVGLHPVWLLFSLSAFGALFGFVGLMVAVPVAAMIGVLIRFAIRNYTDSRLYKGLSGQDGA